MTIPIKEPLKKPFLETIEQFLIEFQDNPNFTLYAFIISFFALLISFIWMQKPKKVILVGLSGAGKTLCFTQLVAERFVNTVTSMKVNTSIFELNHSYPVVVDIPGFERLRTSFWEANKRGASVIVFMIDSASFSANMRDVADYLYTILVDSEVYGRRLPVLIACNKQDILIAKFPDMIRQSLEKEFNAIRESRLASLELTNESNSNKNTLGKAGKEFNFDDLRNEIDFVGCSCMDNTSPTLESVRKWIYNHL